MDNDYLDNTKKEKKVLYCLKVTLDDIYEKKPTGNFTMAAATSSASSDVGNQTCTLDDLRRAGFLEGDRLSKAELDIRQVMHTLGFRVPNDVLELLDKTVGWGNSGDMIRAREFYTSIRNGRRDPNFNIEKELEKLKGLASALGSKYDIYSEECRNLDREYEAYCQSLVEKLVEQVPNIKDMPGYERLTTYDEKFRIEKALRNRVQKVKQVADCAMHLEIFRREVGPMAEKHAEAYGQLGNVHRILRGVNQFIQILATIKQGRFTVDKDNSGRYDMKRKINKLEILGNVSREVGNVEVSREVGNVEVSREAGNVEVSREAGKRKEVGNVEVSREAGERKEVDRKVVEESLLELLENVSGKALESNAAGTEFMKKWDLIVNDFILCSDYLRSCTG
ncbi:hypothetical protein MKW98_004074 [Papaver atlanticum]|uniref:Uncharacterized protein n=1 Tax=Papaver atlanticum TaxID=357466 RepID=A0AAD4XPU1_9MAGN|nr:hypothetical protein MKW98_004074 [Papaver atlanticum]